MSRYRRIHIPGGTYFFTVALADRGKKTLTDEISLLRSVYCAVMREHPFTTEAIVILPDHIHAVWTLPEGDDDFSTRWKKIKLGFSLHCHAEGTVTPSKARKGEKGIWQRRFWEHAIRDDTDFAAHMEYCRFNPVKHGLVERAEDWPYSSFRKQAQRLVGRVKPTRKPYDGGKTRGFHPPYGLPISTKQVQQLRLRKMRQREPTQ